MLCYYIILILNHLKLACNLLLNHCFFPGTYTVQPFPPLPAVHVDRLAVVRFHGCGTDPDEAEEVTCAVCLCEIEEDDEMRELRCNHLFHKVCLDRWLGYSCSSTCPVCRTLSTPAKLVAGAEVLVFDGFDFHSDHRRDNWWLR
ncbi:Ubiquitin-like superfamily protein [Hibiscus syriacus]|uniref:Ubiquitin-like superfamily protein n=1 Tax=Hibiscus syriacus TaxID=106335 RepID=A0A6A2WF40_HIBSY|nr:RING-H2 finger protein ATL46-like [Hibiscus syriacus]KAE8654705.1 Ubiquitin-like superfamily protein [Hibiscus syriacus]